MRRGTRAPRNLRPASRLDGERAAPCPRTPSPRRTPLPEASRWLSFVRLVESRWRVRTTVLDDNRDAVRHQYEQCVEDAWQLAIPTLLTGAKSPCARLLAGAYTRPKKARRESRAAVPDAEFAKKFEGALVSPSAAPYRACTNAALARGSTAMPRRLRGRTPPARWSS